MNRAIDAQYLDGSQRMEGFPLDELRAIFADEQPQPSQLAQNPDSQPNPEQPVTNIKELGTANVPQPNDNIFYLTIIGQIEGHQVSPPQNKATKYEHVIPQLIAAEQNPQIEGVLVVLNTTGGDVEAGLAIAELISSLSKPTVSLVLGGGHSIGIPIAVSTTHSFISPTGTMTVHPIRYTGLVINGHQQFEYLQKMQGRIVKFVCSHSDISEETFNQLMYQTGALAQDIGTILIGKEAVDYGLIKEVGGLSDACNMLKRLIEERREKLKG